MKHVICVDLDGCITPWRPEDAKVDGVFSWTKYFRDCIEAPVDRTMPHIMRQLAHEGYQVYVVTSRPTIVRWHTESWLKDNSIPHQKLIMNDGDISVDDRDFKVSLFGNGTLKKEEVIAFFDDCEKVVKAIRLMGLPGILHEPLRF